jgi:hypothetical protein
MHAVGEIAMDTLVLAGTAAETQTAATNERRRSRRYSCSGFAEVLVLRHESLVRGEVRDISQTGCRILTKAPMHVERRSQVDIRFMLNGHHYHTSARVMAILPGAGVGLEFAHPSENIRESFASLARNVRDGLSS